MRVRVGEAVRVTDGARVRVAVGPPIVGSPVESTVGLINVGTIVAVSVGLGVGPPCAKLASGASMAISPRLAEAAIIATRPKVIAKRSWTRDIIRYDDPVVPRTRSDAQRKP